MKIAHPKGKGYEIRDENNTVLGTLERAKHKSEIWHLRDVDGQLIDWARYQNDIRERQEISFPDVF